TENPAERYAEDNTGNPAEGKASGTVKGSSVQMADEVRIQSSVAKAADSANTKNANPLRIKAVKVADANGQIRCINADHFILATGGMSYPGTGSTGDGYPLASALGHTIEPLFPTLTALMPVNYDRRLEGIQLRNVRLDLYTEQVLRRSEEGELFFTNLGIEGPIGFRVSRQAVVALNKGQRVALHLNLKPALNREQLMARWEREDMPDPSCRVGDTVGGAGGSAGGSAVGGAAGSAARSAAWTAVGAKSRAEAGIRNDRAKDAKVQAGAGSAGPDLPLRLKRYMPEALIAPFTKYLAESGLHPVDGMLSWVFPIASYGDWARAVVTAGGISMKEIDLQTMRSKVVANLSVAGEVLDLDADSGGYNLQIAFATGRVAGKHSNGV
ncbi:MAG: NAD(P)/FAD-dependent oxidoreductase, partial [Bacteroidales bacterium]|nr:NAD(P)/FAD-dependent oxidoreductase [Bacteroidales bacterium]